MGNSNIEWTEKTWNPCVGCSKVSPGCAHCYAETMAARLKAMALADIAAGRDPGRKRHYIEAIDDKGRWSGKVVPVPEALDDPLHWRKPKIVFVNSMSDLFHEDLPNEFIANVFATMYECQWHTFQVLTKRAERLSLLANPRMPWAVATMVHDRLKARDQAKAEYVTVADVERDVMAMWPLPNVWLGVSCENQEQADKRIPALLKTPAAVRFISAEPLLGPIDLDQCGATPCDIPGDSYGLAGPLNGPWRTAPGVNWVIVGGESGPKARPCLVDFIRSIVQQCQAAGVPCFVKQLGSEPYLIDVKYGTDGIIPGTPVSSMFVRGGSKGGELEDFPVDLRVRAFPEAAQ